MKWPYLLMALTAGLLIPVQAGINVLLGRLAGGAEAAAFISFLVGTVALGAYLLVLRIPLPLTQTAVAAPWWYWTGGLLGAFFVTASVLLAPRLGAGVMIAVIIAGQIVASLILDHFGMLGYPVRHIDLQRVLGAILLAAGVFLIKG